MPSASKHLRNAERHHKAATTAAPVAETRAWAAVALFYAAHQLVHAVLDGETVLAPEMRHPESHGGQEGTSILVAKLYRPIAIAYKSLFASGKAVRYAGQQVTEGDFADLLARDFETVRVWAIQRLTAHGRTMSADFLDT